MFKYIRCMADDRQTIIDDLKKNINCLDEHLIKIILFPKCSAVEHWEKEVYSFLHVVNKLKKKHKYPTYSFILDAISRNEDMLDVFVRQVKDEYSSLTPQEISLQSIEKKVRSYHEWIAAELSAHGGVTISQVFDAIAFTGCLTSTEEE